MCSHIFHKCGIPKKFYVALPWRNRCTFIETEIAVFCNNILCWYKVQYSPFICNVLKRIIYKITAFKINQVLWYTPRNEIVNIMPKNLYSSPRIASCQTWCVVDCIVQEGASTKQYMLDNRVCDIRFIMPYVDPTARLFSRVISEIGVGYIYDEVWFWICWNFLWVRLMIHLNPEL